MRLIDGDRITRLFNDILSLEQDSDDRVFFRGTEACNAIIENAPTVEAIPIEWLKENLENTEFVFGSGVNTIYAGETIWELIVNAWREDNGDEWWREEQSNDHDN